MTLFQPPAAPLTPPLLPSRPGAAQVTATLLLELIAPEGQALPSVPGWTLRAWPLARLGDLTLEARPLCPASAGDLLSALQAAGFTPLGLRERV